MLAQTRADGQCAALLVGRFRAAIAHLVKLRRAILFAHIVRVAVSIKLATRLICAHNSGGRGRDRATRQLLVYDRG